MIIIRTVSHLISTAVVSNITILMTVLKFMFSGIVNRLKHRQMGYYKALGACPRKEAEVFLLRTTGGPLKEVLSPGSYSQGSSLFGPQGFSNTLICSIVLLLYSSV